MSVSRYAVTKIGVPLWSVLPNIYCNHSESLVYKYACILSLWETPGTEQSK